MLDETQIVDERSLTTRPEDLIQKTLTKAMKATNLKLHSLKVVNNLTKLPQLEAPQTSANNTSKKSGTKE